MSAEIEDSQSDAEKPTIECSDCGQPFKTAQGLVGHRRLAHSTSTGRALDQRTRELEAHRRTLEQRAAELATIEQEVKRREAEVTRRKREIDQTGPKSIGLAHCDDCGAWFEDSDRLRVHSRSVHPLDEKVAAEVGVSTEKINDVWTEACRKQERHPDESPEQIVKRFWNETDQKILRALLAHNAAFRFAKEE